MVQPHQVGVILPCVFLAGQRDCLSTGQNNIHGQDILTVAGLADDAVGVAVHIGIDQGFVQVVLHRDVRQVNPDVSILLVAAGKGPLNICFLIAFQIGALHNLIGVHLVVVHEDDSIVLDVVLVGTGIAVVVVTEVVLGVVHKHVCNTSVNGFPRANRRPPSGCHNVVVCASLGICTYFNKSTFCINLILIINLHRTVKVIFQVEGCAIIVIAECVIRHLVGCLLVERNLQVCLA